VHLHELVGRVYCTFREWCVDQYIHKMGKKGGVPRGEKTRIVLDMEWMIIGRRRGN
jgi:hypothetical protein